MSDVHALRSQYSGRLNRIQSELRLVSASVRYISIHLNEAEINRLPEFALSKRTELIGIERRLEATYFIRLTAEFEGILKDHLSEYYPAVTIPDNANFDWLISRVFKPKKIIQPLLRVKIDEVRKYRNTLAHRGEETLTVPFAIALQRLNQLLTLLPG